METEKHVERKVVTYETTPVSGSFVEHNRYFTPQEGRRRTPSAMKEEGVFTRYG
jgi:hypothetical protein